MASVVQSVFSELKTGQIVASFFSGDMDVMTFESNLFNEKMHDRPLNLRKLQAFLADMVPDECLQTIWQYPTTTFFSKEIDQISDGLDILGDASNPNANTSTACCWADTTMSN